MLSHRNCGGSSGSGGWGVVYGGEHLGLQLLMGRRVGENAGSTSVGGEIHVCVIMTTMCVCVHARVGTFLRVCMAGRAGTQYRNRACMNAFTHAGARA